MTKIFRVSFLSFLVFATISGCEHHNDLTRASLIVADIDDSGTEGDRLQHLIRYEFEAGELVSTETVLTSPGGQLRFNCEKSRVYRNRYVITDFGDIVDLTTCHFIHQGGSGPEYTRLLGMEGDYVYICEPRTEEYYCYDLARRKYDELEDPGKWALPGVPSPDGTLSVTSTSQNGGEVWLHYLGGVVELLAEGFYVEYSGLSSSMAGVPLLWLDNERVLTQKSNGEIVILNVDGSVMPVVQIDLSQLDFASSGWGGALNAKFFRDFNARIIYSISLLGPEGKFRENRFEIDVESGSYTTYDPEWMALGHQFEYSSREGMTVIRHDGQVIGEQKYFLAGNTQTMDGHIAVIRQESPGEYPTSIRVWSSASGNWTSMDFEFPVWITYSAIVGWIEVY